MHWHRRSGFANLQQICKAIASSKRCRQCSDHLGTLRLVLQAPRSATAARQLASPGHPAGAPDPLQQQPPGPPPALQASMEAPAVHPVPSMRQLASAIAHKPDPAPATNTPQETLQVGTATVRVCLALCCKGKWMTANKVLLVLGSMPAGRHVLRMCMLPRQGRSSCDAHTSWRRLLLLRAVPLPPAEPRSGACSFIGS